MARRPLVGAEVDRGADDGGPLLPPGIARSVGFRLLSAGVARQPDVEGGADLRRTMCRPASQPGDVMNVAMSLRQALLDLGLEDLIPLPEIPTDEDIRKVLEPRTVEDLGTALIGLLREGRIQVWSGHWSQDPEVVDPTTAERLLRDEEQYEFNSPTDLQQRVYYVNVDNIRIDPDS